MSETDKQMTERRRDFPPSETEIMNHLLEKVNNDALWKIRNQFSRY